ncbi:hypothetical protein [Phosphitispora fastidiosa]|uniref:hypothetical protein n=1 Tax=Phosphitispora fastidiosa TaxID=2837202 RepID=UPI001E4F5184|nr:hypothetical protein [Phosphitispora fastidiosa]MBU7008608.1 hypothetical protein [Phosphitispora fastidiosa]
MLRSNANNEGDNMLKEKKVQPKNEKTPKIAAKTVVAKAITKSNNKHTKMLKKLA